MRKLALKMVSMNCKVLIIYTSMSGNTEELAEMVLTEFMKYTNDVECFDVNDLPKELNYNYFDVVLFGTYTWGEGELPDSMIPLYEKLPILLNKHQYTACFGSGDTFYGADFCHALDILGYQLKDISSFQCLLRVEARPTTDDIPRVEKLAKRMVECWEKRK